MDRTLINLKRRLERQELQALRKLVVELHERTVRAEAEAESAREDANAWQRHAMDLQEALSDESFSKQRCVGITRTGELMVIAK